MYFTFVLLFWAKLGLNKVVGVYVYVAKKLNNGNL